MGIMLGHPINNDVVEELRFEVGMTVSPPISWVSKSADCNYH
jgi:hypothetical protein